MTQPTSTPQIIIQDEYFRELRCKNDSCRKLFCFEYILAGRISFICERCGETSIYHFRYLKTPSVTDRMDKEFEVKTRMKGGAE